MYTNPDMFIKKWQVTLYSYLRSLSSPYLACFEACKLWSNIVKASDNIGLVTKPGYISYTEIGMLSEHFYTTEILSRDDAIHTVELLSMIVRLTNKFARTHTDSWSEYLPRLQHNARICNSAMSKLKNSLQIH